MSQIRPFRAVRPSSSVVQQVASVPYDVVDRQEAQALAQGQPLSFLRVSRAEIELPPEVDPYSEAVYQQAQSNYRSLLSQGHLIQEAEPALYIYQVQLGQHCQTGVAATFSVDEYDQDRIKKHEKTRREKEDDRTRHIVTLKAQTGPVFLTYRGQSSIDQLVTEACSGQPLYQFQADDGVQHSLWKVERTQDLVAAFSQVGELYIADGHHRAASASRTRQQLRQQSSDWSGDEPANFFLAVAFPAQELKILPYNRVVRDLNGLDGQEFLARVAQVAPLRQTEQTRPQQAGEVAMFFQGQWSLLQLPRPNSSTSPSQLLDVATLQSQILDPILGIADPRTDRRIDFVGGIRGPQELEKRVRAGEAVAFSMHPTSLEELMAISDAGEIMPPKSTWFEPKLRDALLIHQL